VTRTLTDFSFYGYFFNRPGCLSLITKYRVKFVFFEVINSSATQCVQLYKDNFILQCFHVHIRWESMHIGWSRTCSIGFILSYKIIVRVVYSGVFKRRQVSQLPLPPFSETPLKVFPNHIHGCSQGSIFINANMLISSPVWECLQTLFMET